MNKILLIILFVICGCNNNNNTTEQIYMIKGKKLNLPLIKMKAFKNVFLKSNPHIPEDKEIYHSFLLDKENNILMVGSPFYNRQMENLFKKILTEKK